MINFGPWFSKQPEVKPINEFLVSIDYFHTTHFMGYHRRVVDRYLQTYASVIEKDYCLAVDNYFGNYGSVKSNSRVLASAQLMAYQNHGGKSDIGGGPEMVPCAINAALAGRKVQVRIIDAPSPDIPPTFEPPIYGYYRSSAATSGATDDEWKKSAEVIWSHTCNLHGDVLPADWEELEEEQREAPKPSQRSTLLDEKMRKRQEEAARLREREAELQSSGSEGVKKPKQKAKKSKKSKKSSKKKRAAKGSSDL